MSILGEEELENSMKETLKKLEEMSAEINHTEDYSDEKIFESLGLDLDAMKKMQEENFSDVDNTIKISYKNTSPFEDPKYNHKEDSGFDIRANIEDSISISSLERVLVPTGLYFQIHEDYELQIRPRSGLAAKYGITVLNTPGTVDSNYRGEIKIILVNLSKKDYTIKKGDRIAQGVFSYVLKQKWSNLQKVDKLSSTTRNEGGFGSTGKN
tara:strand:- start:11476 stop:12108 length:633 start_codon:yes stop_codon:yes gene_type:complete